MIRSLPATSGATRARSSGVPTVTGSYSCQGGIEPPPQSTPCGVRTRTDQGLSLSPLPIGLRGQWCGNGESNPDDNLGKVACSHNISTACGLVGVACGSRYHNSCLEGRCVSFTPMPRDLVGITPTYEPILNVHAEGIEPALSFLIRKVSTTSELRMHEPPQRPHKESNPD